MRHRKGNDIAPDIPGTAGRRAVFLAALLAGLVGAAGQVLLLRELLALFLGFEPAAAALLAGWLLWGAVGSLLAGALTAGRQGRARSILPLLLFLLGLLLPLCLLAVRAAPLALAALGEPLGVRPSLLAMCGVSLTAPAPFCLLTGALFACAWQAARWQGGQPLQVYLAESLGAALGGVGVLLCLVLAPPDGAALLTALLLGALAWCGGCVPLYVQASPRRLAPLLIALGAGCVLFGLAGAQTPLLEQASLRWRWGPEAVAARDTPLQRVALLQRGEERSYFGSSGWLFTMPDPLHAEWAVHPALLAHAAPQRVLLLGGNPYALVREARKHPKVSQVDFLEPDAGLLAFLRQTLPPAWREPVQDARVRVEQGAPLAFLRGVDAGYDVVLLNAGEPLNAQVSRLYSVEFLRALQTVLRPGGLLCFGVPAAPEALGPVQEAQLRSLAATASQVFSQVRLVLGGRALFFCSDAPKPLPLDAATLVARLQGRGLELGYVREATLHEFLSPFRQGYADAVLADGGAVLQRVLRPASYFHSAVLWLGELSDAAPPRLLKLLSGLERGGAGMWPLWAVAGLGAAVGLLLRSPRRGVPFAVLCGGAAGMGLEVGVLLAYQGLAGSLYSRVALLLGAWMCGLGLGAWLVGRSEHTPGRAQRAMAGVQLLLALLLALAGPLFLLFLELQAALPWLAVFVPLNVLGGILGGAHFGLATRSGVGGGAVLYGCDLAGAACGSLLAGLVLVPLAGVPVSLGLFALVLAGGAAGLWQGARRAA